MPPISEHIEAIIAKADWHLGQVVDQLLIAIEVSSNLTDDERQEAYARISKTLHNFATAFDRYQFDRDRH